MNLILALTLITLAALLVLALRQQRPASPEAIHALAERFGLRVAESGGGLPSLPLTYRFLPGLDAAGRAPRLACGVHLYGRAAGCRVDLIELLKAESGDVSPTPAWRKLALCASLLDPTLPDFELRPRPSEAWLSAPADEVGGAGLPRRWLLTAPDPEALKRRLGPEPFRRWAQHGLHAQATGGQLLLTWPGSTLRAPGFELAAATRLLELLGPALPDETATDATLDRRP